MPVRGRCLAFAVLVACSGCVVSDRGSPAGTPEARPTRTIPAAAAPLARELKLVDHRLRAGVIRFRARGSAPLQRVERRLQQEGLHQQEIYRYLASKPRLARRVHSMVGAEVRHEMDANLGAARDLHSLAAPVKKIPRYHFANPAAPNTLRRIYRQAQQRFGVPWYVLAAVNFVESKFGRILGPSSAGALGPMQFLPSTFAAYGRGDINDARDSIIAAARYLHAGGAPQRMRKALFVYNRARAYVDAILRYARQMHRYPWSFWAYYEYQVFVSTTEGAVRLTGPGTAHPDQTPGRPAPT